MAAASPAPVAPTNVKLERKLPQFFPTFHDECKKEAETFFQCFEASARMKTPKDTESCKLGVNNCLESLAAYEQCEMKATANEGRPWWKFWGKK